MVWVAGLLLVLGCNHGPADPRPALRQRWAEGRPVRLDPEKALAAGDLFVACAGFKQAARDSAEEAAWARLLTVAARDPRCLDDSAGNELVGWARGRPGWTDAVGEWDAAHGLHVDPATLSPASRLRVALQGADDETTRDAAEAALESDPGDDLARAVLARAALDAGNLAEAITHAEGPSGASLSRLHAQALDEAGDFEAAAAAYVRAGFSLHAAAILYQSLGRPDEARAYFDDPVPPVVIHQGWMALLSGSPPATTGLDDSPESGLIRALAGEPVDLGTLPGDEAAVVQARVSGDMSRLDAAIARAPAREVLHRARLGILRERGRDAADALRAWTSLDPVTVFLTGNADRREAPWAAIVPYTWTQLGAAPAGRDEVGEAFRAALAEPTRAARDEALAHLQADHPELRGLARIRAQLDRDQLDDASLAGLEWALSRLGESSPFIVPGLTHLDAAAASR